MANSRKAARIAETLFLRSPVRSFSEVPTIDINVDKKPIVVIEKAILSLSCVANYCTISKTVVTLLASAVRPLPSVRIQLALSISCELGLSVGLAHKSAAIG